ncbi:MAG: iron ABC transporter permease [Spirochaetales bacterium]|nr:iron ABC transporter permease [Spirochaetales bacterium]
MTNNFSLFRVSKPGERAFSNLIILIPTLVVFLFFVIPVISVLRYANIGTIRNFLTDSYYLSVIRFTFLQAVVSTFVSLILGFPGAWIMSHLEFKGKNFINSLTTVPFVLPSILVVIGFVLCFGNNGVINKVLMLITGAETPPLKILYSFKAIILAHAFYNFPISLRFISSSWKNIGANRIEAAESLGAGKTKIFFSVILPALLPSIIAAASLIFIYCFMSFAVVLILGGGPACSTIEVEIYRFARINLNLEAAASLAIIGACLTIVFTFIYIKLQKLATNSNNDERKLTPIKLKSLHPGAKIIMILYIFIIILLIAGPIIAVCVRSFQSRAGWSGNVVFSLKQYKSLLDSVSLLSSIKNSILYALGTILIAIPSSIIAGYFLAKKRLAFPESFETFLMLPMGVSSIVIGLGYYGILSYLPPNFDKRGLLIIFSHSVIALPFTVKTITTGIRQLPDNISEASLSLGAGVFATFLKVELPLLKGSVVSAAAFAFCISAGEINSSLILSDGSSSTIPIMIYRLISSYNFFGACAMGTILIVICGTAFYLIDKYGGDELF